MNRATYGTKVAKEERVRRVGGKSNQGDRLNTRNRSTTRIILQFFMINRIVKTKGKEGWGACGLVLK